MGLALGPGSGPVSCHTHQRGRHTLYQLPMSYLLWLLASEREREKEGGREGGKGEIHLLLHLYISTHNHTHPQLHIYTMYACTVHQSIEVMQ